MRSLLMIPALLLAAPGAAQWAAPPGAHNLADTPPGLGLSRADVARIVLRDLRAACASDRRTDQAHCARGLRLLAEARDEMVARRLAVTQRR